MAERAADATCSRTVSILGTRVMRVEDPKFLTTGGVYVDDLRDPRLDGAGHVTYVRSVVAHARVRVDASAARDQPGVLAVVTGEDLADLPLPPPPMPVIAPTLVPPWLARQVVRFLGAPVAAIVS